MRRVKTPLKVKITRVENPQSKWEAPFLDQIGDVEFIDRAAHGVLSWAFVSPKS